MQVTIYHNPRCSKSRQTLELLKEHDIEPNTVEYLKTPPDHQTLDRILTLLDLQPRELMRKKETAYKENNVDNPELSRDELIDIMIKNPILIERPIVIIGDKAALGRPPENILDIL